MMGFSCINTLLTSMLEKNIIIVTEIPVHHPQESRQCNQLKKLTVDLIRFVALL